MINFPLDKIIPACAEFGVKLGDREYEQLNTYGNLLLCWNEKINLTAITDPDEVVIKHFLDCILFFKNVKVPQNASIIDVGTGAGFPGVVLKIIRPDITLTLLDSLNKRIVFLQNVLNDLGLNAECVHMRAEEGGKNPLYRERYDIATARAVAALPVLTEYCLPFVKKDGLFVAMKGPTGAEEADAAARACRILGGDKPHIICENLPTNEQRSFILVKKISQTPPKYPRMSAKISKQPL